MLSLTDARTPKSDPGLDGHSETVTRMCQWALQSCDRGSSTPLHVQIGPHRIFEESSVPVHLSAGARPGAMPFGFLNPGDEVFDAAAVQVGPLDLHP